MYHFLCTCMYHIKTLYILTVLIIQLANSLSLLSSKHSLLGLVVFMVSSGEMCVNKRWIKREVI